MNRSIGEHHLWVCPYFSSSILYVLFILFGWIACKWSYSCFFMRCCYQDLFNRACSPLVQFPPCFFSIRFVSVYVVHPYNSIDTTTAWKKSCLILLDRLDFCIIDSLSIAVHAFTKCILTSLSVKTLLHGMGTGLLIQKDWHLEWRWLLLD